MANDHTFILHVSPRGSDQYSGDSDHPLATLYGARNRLRELRKNRPLIDSASVLIHAGDYSFDQSFELTAEDSGFSPEKPIIYRAAPGEKVRLLGGKSVKKWSAVSDASVRNRLAPHVREHVVEADLRELGISDPAPLQPRGFGRGTQPSHCELFFDHRPMSLARWPNPDDKSGNSHLAGWRQIASFPSSGSNDGHGQMLGILEDGFFYDNDRPKNWEASDDIWIHGYWAYDWANSYERITEFDKERRFIKTAPPHGLYGFAKGQKFYFLNVLEELDIPGEYFVDRARGKIYFYPPSDVAKNEAMVSTLGAPLIAMKDAANIEFHGPGLSIECTRGYGVEIIGGSRCKIAGVTIRNTGSYGVWVKDGIQHGVQSCDISNTGDGGVALHAGDRKTLTPSGHFVDNCHFHHQARWSRCYFPCAVLSGVGARVTNNVMHDHPHCPILFTGNEHLIEGNEIYSACWETGDVGGIYMGRDYTHLGNVIRRNFLHHLGGIGLGSFAVYLDDCASGTRVVDNLFHRTNMAVLIGGGRDNSVENNVITESMIGVHLDGRGVSKAEVWHNMVYKTMRERFDDMNPLQPPYSVRYPKLAELPAFFAKDDGVPAENTQVSTNVCVGGQWVVIAWGAKPEWVIEKDNLHSDAPGFVDPMHPEFSLFQFRADSAAIARGHRPIAVEKIGLRKDAFRPSWPRVVSAMEWSAKPLSLGKTPEGTLKLILENQGTAPWTGLPKIIATPEHAVTLTGVPEHAMTIAPGSRVVCEIHARCTASSVELEAVSQDALAPGMRPARIGLRFSVPIARRAIARVDDVASALANDLARDVCGNGANLGTVRLALAGDSLALHARVIDTSLLRRDESPWEGSCIEVFGAMESSGKPHIGQVYLLPAASGKPDAAALEKSGKREPTGQIRVLTRALNDGYELSALIPFADLSLAPGSEKFLLEVIFNSAATPGAGAKRSSLFGSTAAFNNTSRYGRFEFASA